MTSSTHWTVGTIVAALCLLLPILSLQSQTAAEFPRGTNLTVDGVAANDPLNLRAEPNARAEILATLPLGTSLIATGKLVLRGGDKWIEVEHRDRIGWVNTRYVREARPLAATSKSATNNATTVSERSKRVALVVGNSSYSYTPRLANPRNDARAIAVALERLGFEHVTLLFDLTRSELAKAIASFSRVASDARLSMIYFAGHGIEVNGSNYLIPTDAKLESVEAVASEAIELNSLLRQLDATPGFKLIVLDACRDNPFRAHLDQIEATRSVGRGRTRNSIGRGLGRAEGAGRDTLVAYAARHGSFASDGHGPNSPFAAAILNQLEVPGTEVGLFFRRVRDEVLSVTTKRQEPFTYGSIGGEEVFLWPVEGGLQLLMPLEHQYQPGKEKSFALRKETDRLVSTFKTGDLKTLASYVHPISGVHVDGVVLTRKDLLDPTFAERIFTWRGYLVHQGYGEERPIENVRSYMMKNLYSDDYVQLAEVSFGERKVGGGAELDRMFQGRPGSIFVDYYVQPKEPEKELNWSTLRLILEKLNDRWFLVEVDVRTWTP